MGRVCGIWVTGGAVTVVVWDRPPSFFPITINELRGGAWLMAVAPLPPVVWPERSDPCRYRGAADLGAGSLVGRATAGAGLVVGPGCARPPAAGCVPVDWGNRGRKTDKVRLFASSRSLRRPGAPVEFTSRMPSLRICVCVAVCTLDTGMPRLTTRLRLPTIVVEGAV